MALDLCHLASKFDSAPEFGPELLKFWIEFTFHAKFIVPDKLYDLDAHHVISITSKLIIHSVCNRNLRFLFYDSNIFLLFVVNSLHLN